MVSIIIPVYNAAPHLACCIDSILAQTYTDIELILVDDGSTDESAAICDKYEAKEVGKIKVIHQKNQGVSAARNQGLEMASGDYVAFVDSDDWVEKNYIETMLPLCGEDLVCSSFDIKTDEEVDWSVPLDDCNDVTESLSRNITKFSFCSVCCKLYRRDLIEENKIRFNEHIIQSEDTLFVYDYLCCDLKNIRTLSKITYHYRRDNKDRNTFLGFPMEESYLLMDLLSDRITHIMQLYSCENGWYVHREMICSQFYNIYRTIKENKHSIVWKIRATIRLLRNHHVHELLTDKRFLAYRGKGYMYYAIRFFYLFVN